MREIRRTLLGQVVSTKMQKTVIVEIRTRKPHPLYRRIINRTQRFKVHDEQSRCGMGDLVRIIECRPVSKDKHWQVSEIVTRGHVADVQPKELDREVLAPGPGAS